MKFTGGRVTQARNQFAEFEVADNNNRILVDDVFSVGSQPSVNDNVTSVVGFSHFSFCRRKLRPRTAADVQLTQGMATCGTAPKSDHVLITEVKTQANPGEFVEIYNPTGRTMSLADVSLAGRTPMGAVVERWRGATSESLAASEHFLIAGQSFDDTRPDVTLGGSGSFPNQVIVLLRRGPVESSIPIDLVCL